MQLAYQIAVHGRRLPLAPDEQAGFVMSLLRLYTFRPATASDRPVVAAQTAKANPGGTGQQTRSPGR